MTKTQAERAQVLTICITPFTEDGRRLDEKAFRSHLRRMREAGMGVYVGGSGSGEGYTLSKEEKRALLEIAVDELKGKVPVRAMGTEPRTADEMMEHLALAKEVGVDASQVYSLDVGHGHSPLPHETDAYFSEVMASTDLPLVMSTHQSVGYVIPPQVIIDLYNKHDNLIALNVSHQDFGYLKTLIDALAHKVDILTGGPHQATLNLALGGHGYLTSEGNLAPKLCLSVIEAFKANDAQTMLAQHGKLLRIFMALYGNGGIRVTKAVLNRLGATGGFPRKPRLPSLDTAVDKAMEVIQSLDLQEDWSR